MLRSYSSNFFGSFEFLKKTVFRLFASLCLAVSLPGAAAFSQGFEFTVLTSDTNDTPLRLSRFSFPAINNNGEVAYARESLDPVQNRNEYVLFVHDGNVATSVFNFTDAGFDGNVVRPDLNDNGQVAGLFESRFFFEPTFVFRIEPDGSLNVIAEPGTAPTSEVVDFNRQVSMNNAGQIAVLAGNGVGGISILRLDGSTAVEIARTNASFFNFTPPSINDSGRVAFQAQEPVVFRSTFSGDGSLLTNEGTSPGGGASGLAPTINNSGLILDDGAGDPLLYTAQGGVVDVLVTGLEDPVFSSFSSTGGYGFNDFEEFVFVSGSGTNFGVFTGNDPIEDRVIRGGDSFLGGPITDLRMGQHSISNTGQIVFLLQTGERNTPNRAKSYVVLATPISNEPPLADAGPDQTAECASPVGTQVTLDGSGSTDPDNDPLTYTWSGPFLEGGGTVTGVNPTVTLPPPLGTSTITLVVDDGQADSEDTVDITVEDTTPPGLVASLTALGEGDEDGDDDEGLFRINFSTSDDCDPAPTVTAALAAGVAPNVTEIDVVDGQVIEFEVEDEETEIETEDGILEIEAPSLTLIVTATDASANNTVAEVEPSGLGGDNDDDTLATTELDD